jgi:putative transposase
MACGFMYLTAIIDWYSRYVISWEISNSLDVSFCTSILESALLVSKPEIFNTDQGSQYTSNEFTSVLKSNQIKISMDGKGRALDNIFVERLWRTVKYESIYLNAPSSGTILWQQLNHYFYFYNNERPHQSLGYKTPASIYKAQKTVLG